MTDTARDVIARALDETGLDCVDDVDATFVIDALHAAGYRVLGPGELDGETVERCAQAAYVACAETRHVRLGDKAAAAIRSLKGGRNA